VYIKQQVNLNGDIVMSSVQGFSNGGQVRDLFVAYNAKEGSEIVDMSRNYNTGDKYSNQISNGNQIDLALAEINANESDDVFTRLHTDWNNGVGLKVTMAKLQALIALDAPVWAHIDDQVMLQGGVWPMTDLDAYAISVGITVFTVTTGALPTGITINADGTFTGTATNVGAGSVAFTATDDNGASESNVLGWDVN